MPAPLKRPRRPTPLDQLRIQSTNIPPASEYSLRTWLNSAQNLLTTANTRVLEERQGIAKDGAGLEEAFVNFKQAAEIVSRIPAHPNYAVMISSKSPEYYTLVHVRGLLIPAAKDLKEIAIKLEQREIEWEERYGKEELSIAMNGAKLGQDDRTAPRIQTSNSSSPALVSSAPLEPIVRSSIADRMAALRTAGMKEAGVPLKSPVASSSSPKPSTPFPPIPKKPEGLTSHRVVSNGISPPSSPKPASLTPISTTAAMRRDRSGSAPSVIPFTPTSPDSPSISSSPSMPNQHHQDHTSSITNGPIASRFVGPSAPYSSDDIIQYSPSIPSEFTFPSLAEIESSYTTTPLNPQSNYSSTNKSHTLASLDNTSTSSSSLPASKRLANGAPTPPMHSRPSSSASNTNSNSTYSIPFTNEVLPKALYEYLVMALGTPGRGPRVLLLDVRTREEYEQGRVIGESVCLEPLTLREGATSAAIESSLVLSPLSHQSFFANRHLYDVIVIYDRDSISVPTMTPLSSASDSKRALWNLTSAIYENEFTKSLRRQPVLLKGGWEAWVRTIGQKGIVSDQKDDSRMITDDDLEKADEFGRLEARKANNRRTAVLPTSDSSESILIRNPIENNTSYLTHAPAYGTSRTNDIMTPRVAVPPIAVQRSGQISSFEPAYSLPHTTRPAYAQPQINGMYSDGSLTPNSASPTLSKTRSDFGDIHAQAQSYSGYSTPRAPIDYPQLPSLYTAPTQIISQSPNRPPLPPTPLTRPPAIQPAPIRSASNFSTPALLPYPSNGPDRSKILNDSRVGEDWIGLTGLKNLGNTCYMNSTIQCLSATILFARYFKDGSYKRDINYVNPLGTKGALALAVASLIQSMWTEAYNFLAPVTFREQICLFAPQFRGSDQHDAQEFLGFLLDGLHEDLNYVVHKPKVVEMTPEREKDLETLPQQIMSEREWEIYRRRNDSWVVQCFQGQFRNQMKCLTCTQTSTTYNTFMPLSVPVPALRGSQVSLEECISQFVREEVLEKDDAWYCPRCKTHRKATKKLSISRLPPILVIHLKRFSFKGPFSDKVDTLVQYPLSGLDLTGFVPPPLFDSPSGPMTAPAKGQVYDLYAVTNHYGNLSSGHYTAFIRNHRDWYNVGDSKFSRMDPAKVESARSAYILYYRLR